MTLPALQLWTGRTVHQRFTPFERRFSYGIVLIDVDIDRIEDAGAMTPLFRTNRPGFFSFRSRDHGPRQAGAELRPWAENLFRKAGADLNGGMIRLVTFPRHLFYRFAPISLWYGYDAGGELKGIIYEVSNTFGERHCYVALADGERAQHEAEKRFHVSPFFDVDGRYCFTLRTPDEKLSVTVENRSDAGERRHIATIGARRIEATTASFLKTALNQPLSSFVVILGIHWQALQIWLKGARYRRRPALPAEGATVAQAQPRQKIRAATLVGGK